MTPQAPLLLRNASVFDSDARRFVAGLDIVCEEGRIRSLGNGPVPVSAVEVDLGGAFVLPGLIDCHVHLMSDGAPDAMVRVREMPGPVLAWAAAENARRTLRSGVTTVRDLGSPEGLAIHLARATESGMVEGPAILAAGMGVTMTGGHGHGFIANEADGPDAVRKAVREQLRDGATAVKLFASGGVMTPGVDPRSPSLTEEELRAGVEEAHKAFKPVAAHAQAVDGIKNAVRAGVDSIEHGVWLDDEAIELMVEHGTYLVPTLTAPHHIYHGGAEAGIAPYMVDKAFQVLEDHLASFRAAANAGVRIAMGTDEGTPLNRPGENAQEAIRMSANGLSNGAALMAATGWAADLLRLSERTGRLRVGLAADMLILSRDPLEDINALADDSAIVAVVKGGVPVRTSEGWRKT